MDSVNIQDIVSEAVVQKITETISNFDGSYNAPSPFEELLSLGELVDRLSIVNFKLFTLKNEVMRRDNDEFKAWAAKEDVYLVKERSRLKKCIDQKIITMIKDQISNRSSFVPETKLYE